MARKKKARRKPTGRKLRKGFPKKAGAKAKAKAKVKLLTVKSGVDVWKVQNALRKDKYFARAVGPNKVATNAPISKV